MEIIDNFSGKMTGSEFYIGKNDDYYSLIRKDILRNIPPGTKKLLEIGCGEGNTSSEAKKSGKCEFAAGIELFPDAAEKASEKLNKVICGDIEVIEPDFPKQYFDCIVAADVLEHLKNPWAVLLKLKLFLHPDGYILTSIPNIRHLKPLIKIIANRLEYEPSGIFDKTHLRYFTLHTIKKMFDECGYSIIKIERIHGSGWKFNLLRIISLGLLCPFLINQYIVAAKIKA